VCHEPSPFGESIHRPADLIDVCRGLCQQRQSLGSPHGIWIGLHLPEEIEGYGHGLVMTAHALEGDALDVVQESGGGNVTGARGHERPSAAGEHRMLGEPVDVQLVGSIRKGVERPELAHRCERGA